MSVLVKGMKMPKNCGECPLNREEYWNGDTYMYFCHPRKAGLYLRDLDTRHADCPLIELPPHGDLIERSAANLTDFEIAVCDGNFREGMIMLVEKIESAPAIIPADKEGEG